MFLDITSCFGQNKKAAGNLTCGNTRVVFPYGRIIGIR
jgi:hypothetical protein